VIGVGGGVNRGLTELELLKNGGFQGFKAVGLDGGVERTMGVKTAVVSIVSLGLESVVSIIRLGLRSYRQIAFLGLEFVFKEKNPSERC
jgi:hypothetical protein